MPNRIIRESLLDSSRYLSVDEGAQLLYTHLLLLADDFGCLSLEYSFIGRRCFVNRPTAERLDRLVAQLVDVDLIRLYQHRGLHFAFIPRFRQRLKRDTLKNPQPPAELLSDDLDAQEKFNELKGREQNRAARGRPEGGGGQSGGGPRAPEEKRREEKGSEEKRRNTLAPSAARIDAATLPSVISIPLNNNTDFQVTEGMVAEWTGLYPAVDIMQTLREIRGWNIANPSKRKTKTGVLKHINCWLAKEQNSG